MTVKVVLYTKRGATYDIQARAALVTVSKSVDIDYEIVDVARQMIGPQAKLGKIPYFIINDKRELSGVPNVSMLMKIVEKEAGTRSSAIERAQERVHQAQDAQEEQRNEESHQE